MLRNMSHNWPAPEAISLHDDIVDFVASVSATPQERIKRAAALQLVQDATKVAFRKAQPSTPQIQALAFGSHVSGLDSHWSDLDVVITGLLEPDSTAHNGYSGSGRQKVNRHLTALKSCLFRKGMTTCFHVRGARLPILKCSLRSGAEVDVSIADDSGVKAAEYLAAEVGSQRALRPLVMVVKMLLRHDRLADASTGGLSSFALALMAIAHLKASEKEAVYRTEDFGEQLLGFLRRYGRNFDLMTDGVAPGRGGIVCKSAVPGMQKILHASYSASTDKKRQELLSRLCIEDPLTGREIAGGCSKAAEVLQAFANGAAALESSPQVGSLMDVSVALERVKPIEVMSGGSAASSSRATYGVRGDGDGGRGGRGHGTHRGSAGGGGSTKAAHPKKRKHTDKLESTRAKYRGAPAWTPGPQSRKPAHKSQLSHD